MALQKVGSLPAGAVLAGEKKKTSSTVFTDSIKTDLDADKGTWFKVDGGDPVGAAAWLKRVNGEETVAGKKVAKSEPYEYATVDTGKKVKRGDTGREFTVFDIYVRHKGE